MLKKVILIFVLLFQFVHAEEYDGYTYNDFDFSLITMRKSGTHMMKKFFYIIDKELGHHEAGRYYWDHFSSFRNQNLINIRQRLLSNKPTIFLVRDLRDIAVSLVYFVEKWVEIGYFDNNSDLNLVREWSNLSMEQKLRGIILGDTRYSFVNQFLVDDYSQISLALNNSNRFLIVKYEDLVGFEGGGTDETQRKEIEKIVNFLGLSLTSDEIDYVCENLFGVRSKNEATGLCYTYNPDNKGKVGAWEQHFSPTLLRLMKDKYSLYFKIFGYDLRGKSS